MLTAYAGMNRDTYEPRLAISNSFRNHYRRKPLILTMDDLHKKHRPWLKLLRRVDRAQI